jgi:thioredoxin reductase
VSDFICSTNIEIQTDAEIEVEVDADVVIVGSGPAGLSAAVAAKRQGAGRVLVVERLPEPGGLLPQCIHNGFGARLFGAELTGPEYAEKLIQAAETAGVEFLTDAFVSAILPEHKQRVTSLHSSGRDAPCAVRFSSAALVPATPVKAAEKRQNVPLCTLHKQNVPLCKRERGKLGVRVFSPKFAGVGEITAGAVILATGCRERPIGSLSVPVSITGTRPSGVFTAGTAQRMINLGGYRVGNRAVILGSGDIGLIVARRLALTGTEVMAVLEQADRCGGMARNRRQCLDAFDIPLMTRHTIIALHGNARLEAVSVAALDDQGAPVPGTETLFECDTLIVSVGLLPETDLLLDYREKYGQEPKGVFVCGNARKIRQMADDIAEDGTRAGARAASYLKLL